MSGRTISTSIGSPPRSLNILPICHPPSSALASGLALAPFACPVPYGNWYSKLKLKLWRTSEMLLLYSDVKLISHQREQPVCVSRVMARQYRDAVGPWGAYVWMNPQP